MLINEIQNELTEKVSRALLVFYVAESLRLGTKPEGSVGADFAAELQINARSEAERIVKLVHNTITAGNIPNRTAA